MPCNTVFIAVFNSLGSLDPLNTLMQFYRYVDFPFQQRLSQWSRAQQWPRDRDLHVAMSYGATVTHPMDDQLLQDIRLWFTQRGLILHNCYSFIRSAHRVKLEDIHVDTHQHSDRPCTVSLVTVTEGSGPMQWYTGSYQLQRRQHDWGSAYYDIIGVDQLMLAESVDLSQPAVCRADLPHTGIRAQGSEPRVTVTFRFRGNPSFDSVVQKLCSTHSQ